mgnify:FL=1
MDEIQESIEEIIQKHVARMRLIPGHSDYTFDKPELVMYFAGEEAKARSPPVVMPKTCDQVRLGTVYGPTRVEVDTRVTPRKDDYTAFVEE